MVVAAIREAGLNRYRIRDSLAAMKTWNGVTGEILMDDAYSDRSPVTVATLNHGRWTYNVPRVTKRY